MLIFLPPFFFQVFEIAARVVLGVYLVLDNVLPFLFAGEGGVAHGAHIGGFLAGAAVAWVMDRWAQAERPRDIGSPKAAPGTRSLREALARGDLSEAAREYFALPAAVTRGAITPEEAEVLAAWLRRNGSAGAALALLQRVIRESAGGPGTAEAHASAGSILLHDRQDPAAAYQYLSRALRLGPTPETAAEIRRDLKLIDGQQKRSLGRLRRPGSF